ncbi:MAG: muconolactone Delta-isomerase family protein [Anaerolineae bacterium]
MKILAIEKDLVPADQMRTHLKAEALRVWELYQAGIVREMYFHAEQHNAVLILECENVEDAKNYLAMLPLVKAGMIDFEVLPLIPYPGFGRLFFPDVKD